MLLQNPLPFSCLQLPLLGEHDAADKEEKHVGIGVRVGVRQSHALRRPGAKPERGPTAAGATQRCGGRGLTAAAVATGAQRAPAHRPHRPHRPHAQPPLPAPEPTARPPRMRLETDGALGRGTAPPLPTQTAPRNEIEIVGVCAAISISGCYLFIREREPKEVSGAAAPAAVSRQRLAPSFPQRPTAERRLYSL